MAELILSGDSLNTGRIAVNQWYSGSSTLWSATTNNSIKLVNSDTSIAGGVVWGIGLGRGNNVSSGAYSTAINGSGNSVSNHFALLGNGRNNTINGIYSTILNGRSCSATGSRSVVLNGVTNVASGNYSLIAHGNSNNVSGLFSLILHGTLNTCAGFGAVILNGVNNSISALGSFGTILNGNGNSITAPGGFISGIGANDVTGNYGSVITGTNNEAAHAYSVVLGRGGKSRFAGDFVIAYGGGNANVSNNKFRVNSSGSIFAVNTSISTGSDYAEFFEFEDGNISNEDRKGYFVSIKEDKIYIGNDNILGIVSSAPAIVADAADFDWVGAELKNEWGEVIYEHYNKFTKIEDNKTIETIYEKSDGSYYTEIPNKSNLIGIPYNGDLPLNKENYSVVLISVPKLNPDYDSSKVYIPRQQRKEYAPVGLLGKLFVRTSEKITGTKIDADKDGMARNGTKYHVLKTVREYQPGSYGIVQVLFK